tara:strand:+ start:65 stop:934 length:870 start_codon:yes stop_codon:yes gene_type:complete
VTRNSKKLQPEPNEDFKKEKPTKQRQTPKPNSGSPFGISFVVPTEMVTLPSRGKYYPATSAVHGVEEVEVRHMTAKEEDLLSTVGGTDEKNIFDKLIDGVLINTSISSADLLEEDKMAILLTARITGYGAEYRVPLYCEACTETREFLFDLSKNKIEDPPEDIEYDPESDTFSLTLPLTGIELKLLNFNKSHTAQIEEDRKRKEKLNISFNGTLAFLKKVTLSANGIEDPAQIAKLIEVLPAADAKTVKSFFENCRPRINTEQEAPCTGCDSISLKEVPLSWAFFRTDI